MRKAICSFWVSVKRAIKFMISNIIAKIFSGFRVQIILFRGVQLQIFQPPDSIDILSISHKVVTEIYIESLK